jgi:hypothetical protein
VWQFGYAYPSPPRGVASDAAVPATGIPGGAVGIDLGGQGYVSDVLFGDLYGDVWSLDAATGTSHSGPTAPLFSFTTNLHPIGVAPAIYANGNQQFAAFTSGGYDDPFSTSWSAGTQHLFAIKVTPAHTMTERSTACPTCDLAFDTQLAGTDRGFAQAIVVGTQVFAVADSTDINAATFGTSSNTGHVVAADVTGQTSPTTVVTFAGASGLAVQGTTVFSSSSTDQQIAATASSATGAKVTFLDAAKVTRSLWLRTE